MIGPIHAMLALGLALASLALGAAASGAAQTTTTERTFDHIFVIVEENTEFNHVIGNPAMPTINPPTYPATRARYRTSFPTPTWPTIYCRAAC